MLTLPNEHIQAIADEIEPGFEIEREFGIKEDLLNFRLTCRTIQNATRHSFIREYLGSQCLILDTSALKTLADIAKVPDIAKIVDRITIVPTIIPGSDHVIESVKAIDPRYTTVEMAAGTMSTMLVSFPHLKGLGFSHRSCSVDPGHQNVEYAWVTDNRALFYAAAMAVGSLGYRLEQVRGLHVDLKEPGFDISKFANILRTNTAFSTVQEIEFHFECPRSYDSPIKLDEASLGSKLAHGLNSLTVLSSLTLNFSMRGSQCHKIMQGFFKALHLLTLTELNLFSSVCLLDSVSHFLSTHQNTLRTLYIWDIRIEERLDADGVRQFLTVLRDMNFERFRIKGLKHFGGQVRFPELFHSWKSDDPYQGEHADLDGYEEVQEGISQMLECVVMDYSYARRFASAEGAEESEDQSDDSSDGDLEYDTDMEEEEGDSEDDGDEEGEGSVSEYDDEVSEESDEEGAEGE